ncbi:MAG: hypothetical protein IT379_41280 [Deltaproteobacteria bacterium]|nr:hypothetical protein [Deltaproteobacteria bacterium]
MTTAHEAKRQREQLRKELSRSLKQKDREKLTQLQESLTHARATKRARLREVRDQCRADQRRISETAKAKRAELNAAVRTEREGAKGSCSLARGHARETGTEGVEKVKRVLGEERAEQRRLKLYEKPREAFLGKRSKRGIAAAAERRTESDDEVRANLGPEMLPVFEKVKRSIHATPRMTRTEAFLQFVHDNPHVVWEVHEKQAADELRRLEREEREHRRAMKHPRRYKRGPAELTASLEGVPF